MSTTSNSSLDDVITQARAGINDMGVNGFGYRYSDDLLVSYFNTAIRELYRLRPDAFVGNFAAGVLSEQSVPYYSSSDLGQSPETPLPFDDRLFSGAVIFYVSGRAELSDDEFADDNRAMTLLQAFQAMLVGG